MTRYIKKYFYKKIFFLYKMSKIPDDILFKIVMDLPYQHRQLSRLPRSIQDALYSNLLQEEVRQKSNKIKKAYQQYAYKRITEPALLEREMEFERVPPGIQTELDRIHLRELIQRQIDDAYEYHSYAGVQFIRNIYQDYRELDHPDPQILREFERFLDLHQTKPTTKASVQRFFKSITSDLYQLRRLSRLIEPYQDLYG